MVEGTGLENRQTRKRLEGSNPSPSARIPYVPMLLRRDSDPTPDLTLDLNAERKGPSVEGRQPPMQTPFVPEPLTHRPWLQSLS